VSSNNSVPKLFHILRTSTPETEFSQKTPTLLWNMECGRLTRTVTGEERGHSLRKRLEQAATTAITPHAHLVADYANSAVRTLVSKIHRNNNPHYKETENANRREIGRNARDRADPQQS
jgi:hypothetical protein